MAWNEDRARQRIAKFRESVPEGDIKVEDDFSTIIVLGYGIY